MKTQIHMNFIRLKIVAASFTLGLLSLGANSAILFESEIKIGGILKESIKYKEDNNDDGSIRGQIKLPEGDWTVRNITRNRGFKLDSSTEMVRIYLDKSSNNFITEALDIFISSNRGPNFCEIFKKQIKPNTYIRFDFKEDDAQSSCYLNNIIDLTLIKDGPEKNTFLPTQNLWLNEGLRRTDIALISRFFNFGVKKLFGARYGTVNVNYIAFLKLSDSISDIEKKEFISLINKWGDDYFKTRENIFTSPSSNAKSNYLKIESLFDILPGHSKIHLVDLDSGTPPTPQVVDDGPLTVEKVK